MFKLIFLFLASCFSFSQNTQINIDSQFDDWENIFSFEDDAENDDQKSDRHQY